LRCRQDKRNASHGHKDVAVITEPTLQHGHAVNLRAIRCGGNTESNERAPARENLQDRSTKRLQQTSKGTNSGLPDPIHMSPAAGRPTRR